jgi:hypothetical protein
MARKAPIITLDDLKSRLNKYINYDEDSDGFPYNLPEKALSDISKIEFDFENWCIGHQGYVGYPCGYHILPSGIPILLVNAGGDWEFPVCFALYFDGKGIRGYVPSEGNVFDQEAKIAYGNSEEPEDEPTEEELKNRVDGEAILNDINKRIEVR